MTALSRTALKSEFAGILTSNGVGAITAASVLGALDDFADSLAIPQGAWSSITTFAINDVVSYGGAAYIALAANTNVPPVVGATWALFCAGLAGANGPLTGAGEPSDFFGNPGDSYIDTLNNVLWTPKGLTSWSGASLYALPPLSGGYPTANYLLDGILPAALMSFVKGACILNGASVPLSSLLAFSSAAKYTMLANGNYVLNSANGPAFDWSTGRRRLLVESTASTNYALNSESLSGWYTGGVTTLSTTANGLFGILNLSKVVAGRANCDYFSPQNGGVSVAAGATWTATIAMLAGSIDSSNIALYGYGAGVGYHGTNGGGPNPVTVEVLYGPGAIANTTTYATVSGLSATVPTIVRVSRTFVAAQNVELDIWNGASAIVTSPTIGQYLYFGMTQFEPGPGSSYIPCGGTATTRVADVVTTASGVTALLQGANVSLAMRGQNTAPAYGSAWLLSDQDGYGALAATSTSSASAFFPRAGSTASASGSATANFGLSLAAQVGATEIALNGGTVTSASSTMWNGSSTGFHVGDAPTDGTSPPLYLDEIVIWPFYGSSAGIQAQARVY